MVKYSTLDKEKEKNDLCSYVLLSIQQTVMCLITENMNTSKKKQKIYFCLCQEKG